jgi:MFS superfamily sulfate permease-like transporter
MGTVVWTVFAGGIMIAIFATCVVFVAAVTRRLENMLAKRRE